MIMSIYCCGRVLKTSFCPDCGTSSLDAERAGKNPYPYRFDIYLHGSKGDESKDEIIEELGLSNGDVLVDKIIGCDYEVKLTYEIKDENSNVELISATNDE